jgi:hypothetical protein
MQVAWRHIRMRRPAKHGWLFSAFAGIFAIASVYALLFSFSTGLPPAARQSPMGTSLALLILFAMAFAAARVAGWIARLLGAEDHGMVAGLITAPLFVALFRLLAAMESAIAHPYNSPLYNYTKLPILPYALLLFTILQFCIFGTAIFNGGLRLWSYSRRSER